MSRVRQFAERTQNSNTKKACDANIEEWIRMALKLTIDTAFDVVVTKLVLCLSHLDHHSNALK